MRAGQENAATAEANAKLADEAATDAVLRGRYQAGRARMQSSQLAGKQEVAFAKSGVDTSTGSPLDVLSDTSYLGELEAKTIQFNAYREAAGYKAQGAQFRRQASSTGYLWNAAGSALGGVSGAAVGYYGMTRPTKVV